MPCYPIHRISLVDYSTTPTSSESQFQWAFDKAAHDLNLTLPHCFGGEGLGILMKQIQNRIIEKGYVTTRVVTQEQDLRSGTLTLTVITGKHSDVDYMIEANKPSTKGKLISAQYYENPGHHDIKGGNQNTYNASKSVLPDNHLELWKKSIQPKDGDRWAKEVIDGKIIYHRFEYDRNFGTFHWNGSTAGKTQGGKERKIDLHNVPNEIKGR